MPFYKAELDRHFAWFEASSPRAGEVRPLAAQAIFAVVRIPMAILLIAGGIFSILPVFGLWMLPLGLVLFAQDVPVLQKPMANLLGWIERKWIERQRAKGAQ